MSDTAAGPILSFRRSGRRDERDYSRQPAHGRSSVRGLRILREIDPVFWLTVLLLAAAFLLGGASQDAPWRFAAIEIIALAVAGVALPRLHTNGDLKALRVPLILAGFFLLVPLLQLIPLPLDVWAKVPGRGDLAGAMQRFGVAPASLPLSLTPAKTLDAFLWLLIPIGAFLGVAACSERQRRALLPLVVGAGIASALLGFLQLTHVGEALGLYDNNGAERPAGLFANRNHQALFILLGLPLAAAWLRRRGRRHSQILRSLAVLAALSLFAVLTVIVSHSRSGLVLALPAVAAAVVLIIRKGAFKMRWLAVMGAVMTLSVALIGMALSRLPWLVHRFSETQEDYRRTIWAGAVSLAERFSPTGAGIGSFAQVYPAVERAQTLQTAYVNHAHNDYLEVWVCAGYAGVALMLAFGAWLAWRAVKVWGSDEARVGRAAIVVLALVAAHSLVDYPIRTPAIAAVVALSCALLALPKLKRA